MRDRQKPFVGPRIRRLREARGWTLETCAKALGVSVSYLSQIEANQRPLTTRVMLSLVRTFDQPAAHFDVDDEQRLAADLTEALGQAPGDPRVSPGEVNRAAVHAPNLARRYLDLFRIHQSLDERLRLTEEAVGLDEASLASFQLPYEEVRDFFHHKDNYIDRLDRAAEELSDRLQITGPDGPEPVIVRRLKERWGVETVSHADQELLRRYDPLTRKVSVARSLPPESRAFQLAYQLAALEFAEEIQAELDQARFRAVATRDVCRIGLTNYAAAALVMPYGAFRNEALGVRHDLERLALTFQCSLEQAAHRLSTLQRPGQRGLPIWFVRLDAAGNITKRHSATPMRFARFGGACPLWNVHEAIASPDRFLVQIVEMPDGVRYLSVARSEVKRARAYSALDRRYILGFGCELKDADAVVYADGLDLAGPATPIGVSCRICERNDCPQRAFPALDRSLSVPPHERRVVPFKLA